MDIRINLDNYSFTASSDVGFYNADMFIHILGELARSKYEDIVLNISLIKDNNVVEEYDLSSIKRISTWNGASFILRVSDLLPATEYSCSINISKIKEYSFSFDFVTQYPPKQYVSWVWDTSELAWIAPVEYPDDGFEYLWNEDLVDWELVEVIEES